MTAVDTSVPYDTVPDNGVEDRVIIDMNAMLATVHGSGAHKYMNYVQGNVNKYDQSILSDINPVIYYSNCVNVQYYNESNFNKIFKMAIGSH